MKSNFKIALLASILSPFTLYAQTTTFEKYLTKNISHAFYMTDAPSLAKQFDLKTPADAAPLVRYNTFLETLLEQERKLNAPTGKATLGFSYDQAGPGNQNLVNINSKVSLSKKNYPSEFLLESTVDVTSQNGNLQENLADLAINYDYYLTPNVETFVFANRFSDKFMGIDQRYEVGGGVVLEAAGNVDRNYEAIRTNNKKGAASRRLYDALNAEGREILVKLEEPTADIKMWNDTLLRDKKPEEQQAVHQKIDAEKKRSYRQVNQSYRTWRAALLVGIFHETEKSTLSETKTYQRFVGNDTIDVTDVLEKSLDVNKIWRFEVRPTLDIRADLFKLSIRPYFKLPFIKPVTRTFQNPDDALPDSTITRRYDYRFDGTAKLSIEKGPLEFGVSYRFLYDNFAPMDFISPKGTVPAVFVREKKQHHLVRLNFSIKF